MSKFSGCRLLDATEDITQTSCPFTARLSLKAECAYDTRFYLLIRAAGLFGRSTGPVPGAAKVATIAGTYEMLN